MRGARALVVAALAALATSSSTAAPAAVVPRRVLLVGDSVATGMLWQPQAVAAMQKGLAVDWEVEICRTLTDPGCPFDGERPPSLVDVVALLHRVPPTVVVELGYNDPEETFAADVDIAMRALVRAGAQHVLWVTLHDVRAPYPELNELLERATARWPQLQLVDWNAAAYGHGEDWFQNDFVHLRKSGGIAMAHLVHGAVMEELDPLRITSAPPRLRAGRGYSFRLRAAGGTPPYRWRVESGRPPRGFHLLANGRVTAHPGRGDATFTLSVADADGVTATVPATIG